MAKISVGFTGTQDGTTKPQLVSLIDLMGELQEDIKEVHHGDCIGSDSEFHSICLLMEGVFIIIHPPDNDGKRAFCQFHEGALRHPKPYLERNKVIVDQSHVLIATPKTAEEELRSGTWSTVRYARKQGKKIYLILPDGAIKMEDHVHSSDQKP